MTTYLCSDFGTNRPVTLRQNHAAEPASGPPKGVIDGAKNPELIPDSVAYCLYFSAVGTLPNPTEKKKIIQQAHIRRSGLADTDRDVLLSVLAEFKVQHADLIQRYNDSAEIVRARGEFPDAEYENFLLPQAALVQATRDQLKQVLDPKVVAALHAHIQKEKHHMKINVASE